MSQSPAQLENRVRFDLIRYANCWEDADILCAALQPTTGRRILSIASGGDNSFRLLAEGAEVVAADLSAAQLAIIELKRATIRQLDYNDALAFLGARPSTSRLVVYEKLRKELSTTARGYWEQNLSLVETGVIHAGKFERYFHLFRRRVLPWVHPHRTVTALLAPKTRAERLEFYHEHWDTWRWRLLFRVFFSRTIMGRCGRDPEFFRYVEGSVAERILARVQYALTELSTDQNPYLQYILTGSFGQTLPAYLEPAVFPRVRTGLERLVLHHGPIEEAAERYRADGFDGFNLSDIFEYLDADMVARLYTRLLAVARPKARFAYWNMLVPRICPATLRDRVTPLSALATELFARDRAFFYSAFVVEEVR